MIIILVMEMTHFLLHENYCISTNALKYWKTSGNEKDRERDEEGKEWSFADSE